jgi:hypothetical protein
MNCATLIAPMATIQPHFVAVPLIFDEACKQSSTRDCFSKEEGFNSLESKCYYQGPILEFVCVLDGLPDECMKKLIHL